LGFLLSFSCITLLKIRLCEILRLPVDFRTHRRIIVLPYMASIVAKKKANQLYYYVVESARVDGKPRIVQQTYLGTAERVAALVQDRTAPVPIAASAIEFGLPGASLRSLHRSLPLAGGHSPHLPARPKNRGRRLVSPHHPPPPLGIPARAILFTSLLGLL